SPPNGVQLGQQVDFDRRGMTMGTNEDWQSGTSHIGGAKTHSQLEDRQNEQADTEATQSSYQGLELDRPRNSRARSKRYSPGLDEQFHMDRANEAPQQADAPAHSIAGDGGHDLQQRFRAPASVDEDVRQQGAPPLGDEPAAAQVDRGDDAQDGQDVTNDGREPISEGYASLRAQMAQSPSVQTPSLGVADVAPRPDGGEPADEPTQSQAATAVDEEGEPAQSQAATTVDDEVLAGESTQSQAADEPAQSQAATTAADGEAAAGEPTQSQVADEPIPSQAASTTDDEAPAGEPTQSQVADEPTQSQAATTADNEAPAGEPTQSQVADEPIPSQAASSTTDDEAPAGEPTQSQAAEEPAQSQAATTADGEAPTIEPTQNHTTAAITEDAASADVRANGQTATAAEGEAFVARPASQTAASPEDQVLADEPGAQVDAQGPSATATKDEALAAEAGGRVGEGQAQEAAEETNASTAAGAATAQSEDALQEVFEEKTAAAASLAAEEASPSAARTGQADQTATLYAAPHVNHTEEPGTSTVSPPTNPGIGDLHEAKVAQPAVTDAVSANEVPQDGSLKEEANPSIAQYKYGEANESNATEQVQPDSDETGAGRSRDLPAPQDAIFTSSRGTGPETRPARPSLRATSKQQESSTAPEKTLNRSSPLATVAVQSQSDLTMRKSSSSRSETVAETSNDQGGNQRLARTTLRSGMRQAEPEPDASRRSPPAIVGDVQS
ncbi:olpB, partial [Symbiodinium sp. CCMP2456]